MEYHKYPDIKTTIHIYRGSWSDFQKIFFIYKNNNTLLIKKSDPTKKKTRIKERVLKSPHILPPTICAYFSISCSLSAHSLVSISSIIFLRFSSCDMSLSGGRGGLPGALLSGPLYHLYLRQAGR